MVSWNIGRNAISCAFEKIENNNICKLAYQMSIGMLLKSRCSCLGENSCLGCLLKCYEHVRMNKEISCQGAGSHLMN